MKTIDNIAHILPTNLRKVRRYSFSVSTGTLSEVLIQQYVRGGARRAGLHRIRQFLLFLGSHVATGSDKIEATRMRRHTAT